MLNPAGTTPVLVEEGAPPVPGAAIIAEYLDEAIGTTFADVRLLPAKTAEPRRSAPPDELVQRQVLRGSERPAGHGARLQALHAGRQWRRPARHRDACGRAKANIKYHLAYIGWLVRAARLARRRPADLCRPGAAAHLSAVDYLGDVPWDEDETAKAWYARIKSRPSFRPLLGETLPGVPPSPTYANLDF